MPNNSHHHHHGHGTSSSSAMAAKRLAGQQPLTSGQGQGHNRVPSIAGKRKHDETRAEPVAHSHPHSSSIQNHNNKRRATATSATNKFPEPSPEEINFAPPPPPASAPAPVESGSHSTPSPEIIKPLPETKFPEIEAGTPGYARSKNFDYNKPFPSVVVLPPWLTDSESDCPLPALPVIADPDNVRALIEARVGTVRVESSKVATTDTPSTPAPSTSTLKYVKPDFSDPFKDLAFIGDDKLNALCKRVAISIWGRWNRKLVKKIQDDWLSNDNWLFLAIVYRLDLFVGKTFQSPQTEQHPIIYDPEKSLIGSRNRTTETYAFLKSWADIWEAYFAAVIEEREMWCEGMEDIELFLRRLMLRKYRELIPFVMNYDIEHTFCMDDDVSMGMARECITKTIFRTDGVVEAIFGKTPSYRGDNNPWGRLTTYPEFKARGSFGLNTAADRRRFTVDDDAGLAHLLYGYREGLEVLPVGEREEGDVVAVTYDTRPEMEIRQTMYDILVSDWCGKTTPLPRESLQSALQQLRSFRLNLVRSLAKEIPTTPGSQLPSDACLALHKNKLLAMTFWYESRLTLALSSYEQTIHSLLCIIIHTLVHGPHPQTYNRPLLHSCIREINHIYGTWWSIAPGEVIVSGARNVLLKTVCAPKFAFGTVYSHPQDQAPQDPVVYRGVF